MYITNKNVFQNKKSKFEENVFYAHRRLRNSMLLLVIGIFLMFANTTQAQLLPPNSEAIETSGDIILVSLPATALATSLVLKDYKGTWQFAKSFALNQAITFGLKYGINKPRPFHGGPYAFPSGHTSTTFQAASFFHRRYGFKYAIPAYVLAGWTGYSRINATRHDGWDVLAGAVIGIGSSFFFTTPRDREKMEITFKSNDEMWMVGFNYRF